MNYVTVFKGKMVIHFSITLSRNLIGIIFHWYTVTMMTNTKYVSTIFLLFL